MHYIGVKPTLLNQQQAHSNMGLFIYNMERIHIEWSNWRVVIEDTLPLDTMARFLEGMGENHGWEISICEGGKYEDRGRKNGGKIGQPPV